MSNIYYPGMEFDLPISTNQNDKRGVAMPVQKVETFKSFQDIVEKEEKILVKFEADWCMPCKAMASVVEEVANQHPDVKVLAIDIETEGMDNILLEYGVRSLPTFVHLRKGAKVSSACGTISKAELSSLIKD